MHSKSRAEAAPEQVIGFVFSRTQSSARWRWRARWSLACFPFKAESTRVCNCKPSQPGQQGRRAMPPPHTHARTHTHPRTKPRTGLYFYARAGSGTSARDSLAWPTGAAMGAAARPSPLIRPRCISRCQPIFAPDAARRTCFSLIGARRERGDVEGD